MNSSPWVGKVPAEAGMRSFFASDPAIASTGTMTRKRPANMPAASVRLWLPHRPAANPRGMKRYRVIARRRQAPRQSRRRSVSGVEIASSLRASQ